MCWCPAETRTGLLSALASLAVTLGAATAEEADVEKAAKAALRRLAEQRATWLLVYDNVTAPDAIADLLPSAGARVLITSRFSDWSELADEVALDVLPLEEAVALLRGPHGTQRCFGRKDACGGSGLPTARSRPCGRLLQAHADAIRRLCGEGFEPHQLLHRVAQAIPGASPRPLISPSPRPWRSARAAEALMAYLAQCAPERIPMTLVEGAVEDEAERLASARRACRSLAREARPIRGWHTCGDGASSRAGGGTSEVGGKWLGAGCRRPTDCTVWLSTPRRATASGHGPCVRSLHRT